MELTTPQHKAGEIVSDNKTELKFATKDGYIICKKVQLQGKRRMAIDEFLRGYDINS